MCAKPYIYRTIVKYILLLHYSILLASGSTTSSKTMSYCEWPNLSLVVSIFVAMENKTSDSVHLPRVNSNVEVRHLLYCIEFR